jgi:hypothetical protein
LYKGTVTALEQIRANAEMVMQDLGPLSGMGSEFGYNRASVQWLEGYIERLRASGKFRDEELIENLTAVLGSFLGECLARSYEGEWRFENGGWGVWFRVGGAAFPFTKMMKQFRNGVEGGDSILNLFDVLPEVFKRDAKG